MEKSHIVKLYEDGKSTTDISALAGISVRQVRNILHQENVTFRPHGSWKRQYTVNEHYFKTWSPNMAYILGFIAADGVISKTLQCISFSQKEPGILKHIRDELHSDQPLHQNERTGVYLLNIHSKTMKDDLMTLHGITPNKSTTITLPYVPAHLLSHFIRGYFDGDGNVTYPKYVVSFVGGSEAFMLGIKAVLEAHGFQPDFVDKGRYFRLYLYGRRTLKVFADWIYQDKGLYLKRKFDIFQRETLPLEQLQNSKHKSTKEAAAERKEQFLNHYKEHRSIQKAVENIGISPQTVQNWLKQDEQFKKNFVDLN